MLKKSCWSLWHCLLWLLALGTVGSVASGPLAAWQSPAPSEPAGGGSADAATAAPAELLDATLGSTKNVHRCGQLYLAGQFEQADLAVLQQSGIEHVISLRADGELDWDEPALLASSGLSFECFPLAKPEALSAELIDQVRAALRTRGDATTLFHCASANRVGAVWFAFRTLDQHVPIEQAWEEARQVGLKSPQLEIRALRYVLERLPPQDERQPASRQEPSVAPSKAPANPDINAPFLDPKLDVAEFLKRFEVESREVFTARQEIVKILNVQSGQTVADIGAGTGLFTRMIAPQVGEHGRVFAVEIAPAFLQYINESAERQRLANVTPVLCSQRSSFLPAESVDLAFVCDTYHHFTFPQDSLASIMQALKPGGQLVVLDFIREEGVSSDWILSHVRAGKGVVRAEIEAAGFQFVDEPTVPGLLENYVLRFAKPGPSRP